MILVYNSHSEADPKPVKVGDTVQIHEFGIGTVATINSFMGRVFVKTTQYLNEIVVLPKNIGAKWIEGDAEPTLDELFANLQKAQAAYHAGLAQEMKKWPS